MENSARHSPRSTRRNASSGAAPRSRVAFEAADVIVTPEYFEVAGRRWPTSELAGLRTVRGPFDQLTVRAVAASGVSLLAIFAALSFGNGLQALGPAAFVVMGAAAFVPMLLGVVGNRTRPRVYELWGDYQGMTVRLFVSDSERQYGQISRALVRAQEIAKLGGVRAPVSSINPYGM
ncbi:hypothetical protein J2S43_008319 [Catenuloplanes nepalensis]|uniref:PrgI family protein n=1 Tax=Catenuloplanes nepalensis TaxID=587533 RepID=A0ABT9N7W8_9ACTN|nr:DUF6232 family protein [Catenuloplanes nepalensis]MDP9799807.1 hypothetical protein [Catenuloplanes nepalensis]